MVLDLRDSLVLDSAQVALLEPVRDSLAARNGRRLDSLRSVIQREGTNPDPARLLPILRPLFEAARNDVAQAVVTVRAILTEAQWAKVPESVRSFQIGPRPGMGPGPVRPPRP